MNIGRQFINNTFHRLVKPNEILSVPLSTNLNFKKKIHFRPTFNHFAVKKQAYRSHLSRVEIQKKIEHHWLIY